MRPATLQPSSSVRYPHFQHNLEEGAPAFQLSPPYNEPPRSPPLRGAPSNPLGLPPPRLYGKRRLVAPRNHRQSVSFPQLRRQEASGYGDRYPPRRHATRPLLSVTSLDLHSCRTYRTATTIGDCPRTGPVVALRVLLASTVAPEPTSTPGRYLFSFLDRFGLHHLSSTSYHIVFPSHISSPTYLSASNDTNGVPAAVRSHGLCHPCKVASAGCMPASGVDII